MSSNKTLNRGRAGNFVPQPSGYTAFIPNNLPPPDLKIDVGLTRLLSEAERSLGRLDGVTSILPNPDLFVAMYVKHEAVLSSQIEGTQCTLEDVLEVELEPTGEKPKDIAEVVNYVGAMNYGLERLVDFPLSLRLIKEIHAKLLEGVRGAQRDPGEFRRTQNWIGPSGCTLANATFVPPPVPNMQEALGSLETFMHEEESVPTLIQIGLIHAQFETIHPFLDGNGRIGRLLITFLLCQRAILQRPLLYLSYFFKLHRAEYYDRLTAIRTDGHWEQWLNFFLRGVSQVSQSAVTTAQNILRLQDEHRKVVTAKASTPASALRFLEYLFKQPLVTVRIVERELGCAFATASKLIEQFTQWGLLQKTSDALRNREFEYRPYLALFDDSSGSTATKGSK
jgi:Fic family protein